MHGTCLEHRITSSPITVPFIEKIMKPSIRSICVLLGSMTLATQISVAQDADTLKSRARALYQQGSYEQAIAEFERALSAARQSFGENSQKADIVANELAMSYYNQSRYQDAEPIFQRVLENHQARLGANHSEVATCWNNLGALYDAMGDYLRAENAYLQSYQILAAQYGPDHVDLATTYNNLGAVYRNLGDSSKSVTFYLKSRQLYEQQSPRNLAMIANVTNNLASAYVALGQHDQAEPLFRAALQMREERLGPDHPSVATTLNNLASLLEDLKQFDQVEAIYHRALKIRQEKLGSDHPAVATTMNNLASLYRKLGRYEEAERYHLNSLQIRETKLGRDHPLVAIDLNNLAGLSMDLGRFDDAASMYQRSLKIRQAKFGAAHPEIAQSWNNLGFLHAKQRNWQQAAESFDQCRRIVRQHVSQVLPSLSESEQLTFLQTTDEHYLHAALAMAYERRNDPAIAELSAAWVLNAKGIAQQTLAQKRVLDRCEREPASAADVRTLQQIRRRLARLVQTPIKPDEADRAQEIESLLGQEQAAAERVAKLSGQSLASQRWSEIDDVRRALPDKSVLIEIARFRPRNFQARSTAADRWLPPRYAAWIIPAKGKGEIKIVDLGEAAVIDQAVIEVRKALDESGNIIKEQGEVAAEQVLLKSLTPLAEQVLGTWLAQLPGVDRLILSPDAMLWLVPWSALPLSDQKYAVEQFQIDYVVSGRDLLLSTNLTNKQSPAILFSDPDYDLDAKQVLNAVKELFPANQVPRLTNLVRPKRRSPKCLDCRLPRSRRLLSPQSYKPLQLRNRSVLLINMLKKPLSRRSSVRRSW